jgi:carbon monoxide dehydrogenase subunit G
METVKNSVTIKAPVEKVFQYIDDPQNDPEWMINMIEVHDVGGPSGMGRHFHWTFKMAGIPLKGKSTTIEHVPNRRTVTESKGQISSTWAADVEPAGDGTKLTMKVDYTIPIPVLGKLAEHLVRGQNERNLKSSMTTIKEILEA